MTRTFLFTAACLALTLGCTPPPSAELTEDDRDAIRQFLDEVARNLSPEERGASGPSPVRNGAAYRDDPANRG